MSDVTDRPFVLVHGGRHGGWCWRKVAPVLRREGHEVHALTLTGLGERSHLLSREIGLDTHVADLVGVMEYEDLHDVILVAHSYGGMVVTNAMEQIHERVRHLVYLDAHLPATGQALFDLIDPSISAEITRLANEGGDGWYVPTWDSSRWGLTDPADITWVNSKATPQPLKTYTDPSGSTERARAHRSTFVECATSALSAAELAWHRARCEGSELHRRILLDTTHEAMVTEPDAVSQILLNVAAQD